MGSVYFEVKTLIEAATKKKWRKAKKNLPNFDDTKRDRKAEKDDERAETSNNSNITHLSKIYLCLNPMLQLILTISQMFILFTMK